MPKNTHKGGYPAPRRAAPPSVRQSDGDDSPLFITVLKNSALGLIAALLSGILLISVSCAIAYANPNPEALTLPLALASLMVSMFVGGFVCSRLTGSAPLFCGIVCGGMITLCTMLLALCLVGAPSIEYGFWLSALIHAFAIMFCSLGALMGNMKRRPKPMSKRFR
jgi:putative membrane protein (TIGR04086 family)